MDPNLFHLDWERTLEALAGIVVLSFLVERVCALLFESRWWISRFEDARVRKPAPNGPKPDRAADAKTKTEAAEVTPTKLEKSLPGREYPLKEALGFVLAFVICRIWSFDAVSIVLLSEHTQLVGVIVTAAIVAGGSKGSIALFHDVLKIRSSAGEELRILKERDKQA
jgi:hypothetical protein